MNKLNIYESLQKDFLQKKLNSPLGLCLVALIAVCLGVVVSKGLTVSALVLVVLIALAIAVYAFINEGFGLAFTIGLSSITAILGRIVGEFPFGTLIEVFIFLLFIGVIIRKTIEDKKTFNITSDPIAIALLCILTYQTVQCLNPNLSDRTGALLTVKRGVCMFLLYLVFTYSFSTKKRIYNFIKFWVVLSFIIGLYGCKQEWLGFFNFETNWLFGPLVKISLIFVDGRFRKFSFLDSPTNFGMMMGTVSVFAMVLLTGKYSFSKKVSLVIFIAIMLLGTAYSGTRTAYVMVLGGMALFFLMTINRGITIIFGVICLLGVGCLLYIPSKDPNILRIRTVFNLQKDESLNIRDVNRAKVQPVIHSHPFGVGLSTVGVNGARYNPNNDLAGFPPDSEYLKTAIETGFFGYFLMLVVYGLLMIKTVQRFFNCEDQNNKTVYAGLACAIFTIVIANYSQETAMMFPNDIYYIFLFAISASLYKFDPYYLKNKLHDL